jgi:GntR family transcriptional regulator / MocR family aminotransferase
LGAVSVKQETRAIVAKTKPFNRAQLNATESVESIARGSRADWADLLDWRLSEQSTVPIYQQVAHFVRDNITSGLIPPGSRLPSSRHLAGQLKVSRNTIITAYSQLLADGYIVGQIGSGTFVAPDAVDGVAPPALGHAKPARAETGGLSERGKRYQDVDLSQFVLENVPFNTGIVRVDGWTSAQWRRIASRKLAIDPTQLGYFDPVGDLSLRGEIARYVAIARGVRCSPEQIVVVAGAQQAIDLTIKVLLEPGASVWIEDPGYPLSGLALSSAGVELCPVRVDEDGICVADGIARWPKAKAAFVTPSHQYPLGVALSLSRRAELLDWAVRTKAWIVEDDYDAEFRYGGAPLPALQALDAVGRVIYIGTFSKVLFPGIRYGYIVVPLALVPAFAAARFLSDRQPSSFFGGVLAEFIGRGYFVSHIRRMRNEYRRARDILVDRLSRDFSDWVDVASPNQGMHLIAYLRDGISDVSVASAARDAGIVVRPISRLYRREPPRSGLMLGFAGFDEHRMRSAAARLKIVLENATGESRVSRRFYIVRR